MPHGLIDPLLVQRASGWPVAFYFDDELTVIFACHQIWTQKATLVCACRIWNASRFASFNVPPMLSKDGDHGFFAIPARL